ncbi:MAG TPA: M20/M25/M40 family metallo-hydrolase [Pyrinomonadaceae bacterium]|nr:M20/M25/M40 family metallo-hydrolase [Pyrinomonadaceae bacterium]
MQRKLQFAFAALTPRYQNYFWYHIMKFKSLSRYPVVLSVVMAVALVALAQQPALSVDKLRAHITYLASDKLEGRRTGTEGANLAAEYIAKEFARYGVQRGIGYDTQGMSILEADSPNRYLQKFPYVAGVELGRGNSLSITFGRGPATQLLVGEDWMPLGFSSNAQLDAKSPVFVGYGITAAQLNYNDYANDSASGTVAVALYGSSDGDNPHGPFARYEDARWKAIAARNAGAKALMIIARESKLKEDRLARLRFDNSAGEAGIPVMVISQQLAARLFAVDSVAPFVTGAEQMAKSQSAIRPVSSASIQHIGVNVMRREVEASNVVGIVNGSDPVLKNEYIVIGAHYDHLGRGGEGSLAPREGDIHHGADDNASGTAGLLELARMFASSEMPRPKRTLVLVAFSGEEEGLLGSNYYVNHPIRPLEKTVAMINMDMIGRMKDNKLIIGGVGTAQSWREEIATFNTESKPISRAELANPPIPGKVTLVTGANGELISAIVHAPGFNLTLSEDGYGPSDHSSFYAKKIPVLFLWTGTHEDYHKPSDTADKINYNDETRILSFVARLIRDIDQNTARPIYTVAKSESQGRAMGFRVYLGTIPNYADSNDGLLLDGVRDDSPAAKAGIKAGDRIIKLAGRDVHNVYDYTYALGEMKAGQEYEVELVRGTERLKLTITPAARK